MDPLEDIEVINLELALSDLFQIEKRLERLRKGECDKGLVASVGGKSLVSRARVGRGVDGKGECGARG